MGKTYNEELTDAQVADIRRKLVAGWSVRKVAVAYNRPYQTILRIRNGDTYAHVQVAGGDGLAPAKVAGEMPVLGAIVEAESILAREGHLDEAAMQASMERAVALQKEIDAKGGGLFPNRPPVVDEEFAAKQLANYGLRPAGVSAGEEGLSADEFRRRVEDGEL
jgi:hypothetical protein